MARYKLQLKRLDFLSVVDSPAQEPATCLLIKRHGTGHEISATARFVKSELGLAFFWAVKSTDANGDAYHDLQGDQVLADDDMVKAAMEFMERGAAVDQQHDRDAIGKTIFCMPMTPEIAKAYGIATKQSGLMVALKPSADVMKKLQDGTYTGVSIEGTGLREEVSAKALAAKYLKAKMPTGKCTAGHAMSVDAKKCADCGAAPAYKSLRKQVVLTSETDGHQHAIDLDDPADYCGDRLSTTYATSEGAETQHAHVWTFDPQTGEVTIAMDSGHDHTVSGAVPPEVLAVFRLNEQAEQVETTQALLQQVLDGDAGASAVNVTIAARSPRANSTPRSAVNHAANTSKENAVDELKKQLADAVAKLQHAERIAKMTGAHKAHFDSLTGENAEAFLAKSTVERDAVIASVHAEIEKGNAVEYVGDDGSIFRKSDDPRLIAYAKKADEETRARKLEVIKSRVKADISHLPGSDDAKIALLKAVDGIADEKIRGEILTTLLKGADDAAKSRTTAKGFNPGGDMAAVTKATTYAALATGLAEFAKKNSISTKALWTDGLDAFEKTPEGGALVAAYEAAKQAQN